MNKEEHIPLDEKEWNLEDIDYRMDVMYDVVTGQRSMAEVLAFDPYFIFPFDPTEIPSIDDIADMERHYAEREEYEVCIILRDYFKW